LPADSAPPRDEIRVAQVISRLNIGGPAIQAITLSAELEQRGYRTLLLRGEEGPREGTMDDLAGRLGVEPVLVRGMAREIGPADVPALARLWWQLWRFAPTVVHTHAAKAGTLGRVASMLLGPRRPRVIVHMFHGHSLSGYWSGRRNRVLLAVERWLANRTDILVAVSEEVRDDLVRIGVARAERFVVIPLGLDLSAFVVGAEERARRRSILRGEWRVPDDALLVTLVARLVPIKRVDRFLRVATRIADASPRAVFAVVGDGELHDHLRASPEAARLGDRLRWAGFRRDMPDVCFASDLITLTSDNEGTPVSLIEAQAAGVAVVATRVGGATTVVPTGNLADPEDEDGFADKVVALLADADASARAAEAGRTHVLRAFTLDRLVADVDALYRRLLAARAR
jgi:glycosyltransferase involved in cell wall biosynthesis